jgi:hypothetical protein
MRALALALLSFAAVLCGCVANIPNDRFSCLDATGCPTGFTCTDGFCHSGVVIRFVQADPRADDAVSFRVRGAQVASLAYGRTSETVDVPLGATIEAWTGSDAAPLATYALDTTEASILVLRLDAADEHGFTVLPDDLEPGTAATVNVRFVDATLGEATAYSVVYSPTGMAGAVALPRGTTSAMVPLMPGTRSLGLLAQGSGGPGFDVVAGFAQIPIEQSAYVVIAGDLQRHLGAPDGPRAIVVGGGTAPPTSSEAIVYALNATIDPVVEAPPPVAVCLIGAMGTTGVPMDAGEISNGMVITRGTAVTAIGFDTDMDVACSASAAVTVPVMEFEPARRYLITLGGALGGGGLRATVIAETAFDPLWVSSDLGASFTHDGLELIPGAIAVRVHEIGMMIGPPIAPRTSINVRIDPMLATMGTLDVAGDDVGGTGRTFGPFATPSASMIGEQVFVIFGSMYPGTTCTTDAQCAAGDVCIEATACLHGLLRFVSAPYGSPMRTLP